MAATSQDPTAARAAGPTSRHRPLPALPSLARLPALLGHGPLHPSRLLTALRRIPLGGCVAILSELQSQDRPPPQPDWEARERLWILLGPAHFRGGAPGWHRPLTSASSTVGFGVWEMQIARRVKAE